MLAGIHPHSAERVLQALTHDHHVTLRKSKYRLQITKRVDHPDWRILAAIFDAAETMRLDEDRKALNRRAQQLLPFIALVTGMVKRARRKRRVA